MSLLRSTVVIGGLTGISRVLGFLREMLIAAVLGAGAVSDGFFTAFRLPNLFRRLLAEGAFNAAFVPLYTRRLDGEVDEIEGVDGRAEADRFASETFSVLLVALLVLVVAFQAAMPWVIRALAPGYWDDPTWVRNAGVLGLITMPYILFMSLTAMFGGVLNAHGRFAAFAFAPVLLNVILVALLLSPIGEGWNAALWLSIGVAAGGVAQLAVVVWGAWRQGVRIRLVRPRLTPGVKRLFVLGVPGAIAAGVTQINIVISQQIASLQSGAISWLSYADRIYQLPLGMIGIAMGVALLPALSRRIRAEDYDGARQSLASAVEIAAALTLPAAVAIAAAPAFWTQGLYERGAFSADSTQAVAAALAAFAVGLPAFIAVKVLAPAFFAREDTSTPMRYAGIAVVINVVLGVALFATIGFVGLAIATSTAGYVNAGLLARTLARDGVLVLERRLISRLVRIAAAAAVMGVVVWALARAARPALESGLLVDVGVCLGVGAAGFAVYVVLALTLGGVRFSDVRRATSKS